MKTGSRLGAYDIVSLLGAGGMGEVYRAHDAKLGRDVAIKILPPSFAADPERLTRFDREARLLASLNHPHIAQIYGLETQVDGGAPFIVMELVEGETLAEGMADGSGMMAEGRNPRKRSGMGDQPSAMSHQPLTIAESLAIARQLADALDAAHERGIVHRDLKPANIKITPEGVVKVLDFGLAKFERGDRSPDDPRGDRSPLTHSPTMMGLTFGGVLLGTAPYMSPEQARGKTVDKRADIWAFGCVLYEMLTGRRAFVGETTTDVLAKIVERDPDWTKLPAPIPPPIVRLLKRCLEKDPKKRLRDIGDARVELDYESVAAKDIEPSGTARRLTMLVAIAIAGIAVLAATAVVMRSRRPGGADETTLHAPLPTLRRLTADAGFTGEAALSRDGALLAYASDRETHDNLDIWVQQVNGSVPIRVTRDPLDEHEPAFSPDGSRIAFRSERDGGGIYVVQTFGGTEPRFLVKDGRRPRFSPDGRSIAYWAGSNIGFSNLAPRAYRTFVVESTGGTAREVTGFVGIRFPIWSADGRSLLVVGARDNDGQSPTAYDWWVVPAGGGDPIKTGAYDVMRSAGLDLGSANVAPEDWRGTRVTFSDLNHLWAIALDPQTSRAGALERLTFGTERDIESAVSSDGQIAFTSATLANSVYAIPIDADRVQFAGPVRRLSNGIGDDARASASADGRIVAYRSFSMHPIIVINDLASGHVTDLGVAGSNFGPALSPDGRNIAFESNGGVHVVPAHGGAPRELCRDCTIGDWLSNGSVTIVRGRPRADRLAAVDIASGLVSDLVTSSKGLSRPHPSPDGSLLAFRVGGGSVAIAPVRRDRAATETEWIPAVPPEQDLRPCGWSPNGAVLYILSGRDGTRCLYALRVDRATGKPQGDVFAVRHFHGLRNAWAGSSGVLSTGPGNAVRGGLFLYDYSAVMANIWMLARPGSVDTGK